MPKRESDPGCHDQYQQAAYLSTDQQMRQRRCQRGDQECKNECRRGQDNFLITLRLPDIVARKPSIGTHGKTHYNAHTMKTIDHRILIPSPPDRIWDVVSDLSRNPDWQIDCREVIFLTSKRSGAGLRWRYSDDKRHEYVYEVSAWYAGLGYEYYFVDGSTFRDARGRVRLQDTPEGTIVQWTFSYEAAGLLSGTLGLHGALDRMMQDSLRQLWSMSKNNKAALVETPKSLMRDAPDVEARIAYQPRRPTRDRLDTAAPASTPTPDSLPMSPLIEKSAGSDDSVPSWSRSSIDAGTTTQGGEPDVAVGDTRPNPSAGIRSTDEFDAAIGFDHEPDFLEDLVALSRFEPPPPAEATQPAGGRLVEIAETPAPLTAPGDHNPTTNAESIEPVETAIGPSLETRVSSAPPTPPSTPKVIIAPERASAPVPAPRLQIDDTRTIWEIFNVARPTEPSDLDVAPSDATPTADNTPGTPTALPTLADTLPDRVTLTPGVRGLRQAIRHKAVRVRRPY